MDNFEILRERAPGQVFEDEAEKASNSYLISTVVMVVGLPIPIINMLSTWMFYMGNRKKTYYVRYHCMQSLLMQAVLFVLNTIAVVWTLRVLFGAPEATNNFFGFVFTVLLFNLLEFIVSIYATVKTRKKEDVSFWVFGPLSAMICKK